MIGITLADVGEPEPFEVWPENWEAVLVFVRLSTQWRTGFSGPTGLDYAAIDIVLGFCGIEPEDRVEFFENIRILERSALAQIAENQQRATQK